MTTHKEALTLALEDFKKIQHSFPCDAVAQRIAAIEEALAQPEQEPVAKDWRKEPWGFGEKRLVTVQENTTPPQPKEPEQKPKCNPHPKAPHGFNRNASHANDRYTCECESWDAYDAGYQAGVMAGIEASMRQEPEQEPVAGLLVGQDSDGRYVSIAAKAHADTLPLGDYDLYTSPQPQRTWVGITDDEISELIRATHNTGSFVRAIEAKLKEKNT